MSRKEDYLISDNPMKAIIVFSLPMMIGNLFQQFYTMADSMIVGRFIGEDALASVGASYALTSVFIAIATGGGIGATVLTSTAFGSRSYSTMKESISTALLSFLVLSIVLAFLGYWFSPEIIRALNTPGNIIDDAVIYLRIYFLGLPFLFMYNILSSIFNSLGKSRIPLFLLIFSSIMNIGLDIVAVTYLQMGVAGAAWATLLSQAVSAFLSFMILISTLHRMEGRAGKLFSSPILRKMAGTALPSILQQSAISIGMMLVQSVVNIFGSEVLAGYSASIRVDSIVTVPISAIGNAMSPYTAQNIGAGKDERIHKGFISSLILAIFFCSAVCIILQSCNSSIIGLFLGDEGTPAAYSTGERYLSFLGWFYSILGFAMVTGGVLRGAGDMRLFTVASIANLAFRVIGSLLFAPRFGVAVVWYVVPVGWTIYFAVCLIAYMRRGFARS